MNILKLTDTDLKILNMLSDNGRMSYGRPRERLDLSRVAVRDRIYQMQESGIIEKFSVVINSEKVGKGVFRIFQCGL